MGTDEEVVEVPERVPDQAPPVVTKMVVRGTVLVAGKPCRVVETGKHVLMQVMQQGVLLRIVDGPRAGETSLVPWAYMKQAWFG
ncbi:MAG: hypothetical protein R6U98_06650 [Pirellulaceae bacterium]